MIADAWSQEAGKSSWQCSVFSSRERSGNNDNNEVCAIICENYNKVISVTNIVFDREKIVPEANLLSDLGLNSLDVVNVVVAFEDAFGIEILLSKHLVFLFDIH
ncbi:MAG: hypothetical protein IJ711_04490 [Lachnospiraceae bacterium]|nr:hypothetical protein [Lachnospiraceae bacterium]